MPSLDKKELPNSVFLLLNKFIDKFNKIVMTSDTSFLIDYTTDQQKDLSLFLRALKQIDSKEKKWHIKISKFDRSNRKIEISIEEN